ncbi:MAG TPA: FG-GAP-like repeat-containing protein, partial [Pirellulales bacterium]|nr:FG-GAP-like repeat-containing protein [Pirellulales bacterium]
MDVRRGLRIEPLEERRLLAVDMVTSNLDDGGAGTLRSVIAAAASGDTIQFDSGITQIDLTQGQIEINKDLTIQGLGASSLTIDQTTSGGARVFQIEATDANNNPVDISVSDLTVTGGDAQGGYPADLGGGIDNYGSLAVTTTTISGNSAAAGGGIFNESGATLTLTDSTVSNNSATEHGGGIDNDSGAAAAVTASTIVGNSATGDAGGIFDNTGGSLSVIDSTFTGNSGSLGGAIYNAGTTTVTYSTLSGNPATQGGGIDNLSGATANVANTILAGNAATGSDPDVAGAYAATDADLIGVVGDASGFTTSGPVPTIVLGTDSSSAIGLGPLADNGGPTQTMALLAGSPAIGAGDVSPPAPFSLPKTDQRGNPRLDGVTDIGAYQGTDPQKNAMYAMTLHTSAQTGLPAVTDGAMAFGDVNNDGKLDVIVTGKDANGTPITELWINQGNDIFQQAPIATTGTTQQRPSLPASVVGLYDGSVAFGDYDNDGYLDLVITGFDASGAPHTYLLHNEGASNPGAFDDVTQIAMPDVPGVGYSSVTWGMINSDGRRDILLSGQTADLGQTDGAPVTQLWLNDGRGGFYNDTQAAFPAGIAQVDHGSASWADLDDNGYFGFVLTGNEADGTPVTQVWRNNADGTFHLDTTAAATLPQLGYSSAAFTYYAFSDSQPTLLISGQNAAGQWETRLFKGELSAGSYGAVDSWQDITDTAAPGLSDLEIADPTVAWGDFDATRFDSFVIGGEDATNNNAPITQLWFNNPFTGTFSNATAVAFGRASADVSSAAFAVGDAEGDRGLNARADLLLTGEGPGGPTVQLWANNGVGIESSYDNGFIIPYQALPIYSLDTTEAGVLAALRLPLYYDPATGYSDNATAHVASLTFNFLVSGGITWLPEELSDGTPTVPDNNLVLRPQQDLSYGGSYSYGAPDEFSIEEWIHLAGGQFLTASLTPVNGVSAAGLVQVQYHWDLPFLQRTSTGIGGGALAGPTLQWLDVNGDGKLDLFVGNDGTAVWQNNGDGTFTNVTAQLFPGGLPGGQGVGGGLSSSAFAWGDYNNDGLPDLLISGADASGNPVTELWRNNGPRKPFTNVTAQLFPDNGQALAQLVSGSAAWGDFNNDGRLDLLITGVGYAGAMAGSDSSAQDGATEITQLWEQNANGTFTDVTASAFLPPTANNPWSGGFNADLLPSGFFAPNGNLAQYEAAVGALLPGTSATRTVEYDEAQHLLASDFAGAVGVPGLMSGSVSFVDYNNDGLLDLLISGSGEVWDNNPYSGTDLDGQSFVPENFTELWQNNGDGTFTNVTSKALPGASGEGAFSVAWGDYDNDGHVDLYLNTRSSGQLWHNNGNGTFTISQQLAGGDSGSWADVYGNGNLDLLVSIDSDFSTMYSNNGDGTFSQAGADFFQPEIGGSTLNYYYVPPSLSSAAFGDYLGNGRLGVALANVQSDVGVFGVPNIVPADVPPTVPTSLQSQVNGTSVTFSWQPPAQSGTTPAKALVYKLRVGTTPGDDDVVSPVYVNADSTVLRTLSYTLQGLTPGLTYYWSVEAIDNSYHTSPFAAEQSFTVNQQAVAITAQPSDETVSGGGQATFTASAYGAPDPSVQWKYSTDGGTTFTAISDNSEFSGATSTTPAVIASGGASLGVMSATLTIDDVPFSLNGDLFEAVFSNGSSQATTSAATLTLTTMTPTVTITGAGGIYDGAAHGVNGMTVSGAGGVTLTDAVGDRSLTYTYYSGSFTTAAQLGDQTPLAGAPSAAGTYTAVAHWTAANWNGSDAQDYTNADSTPAVFAIRAASLIVTTTADSDPFFLQNTLREAIAYAGTLSGTPAINVPFQGGWFDLNSPLVVNHSMTIGGETDPNGAETLDAQGQGSVFDITSGTVTIKNLILTGGSAANGGAIDNEGGTLTLDNDVLVGNMATKGGGVYTAAGATTTLVNVTLADNSATAGGGLFNDGTASLTNVTVTGNTAAQTGGGLDSDAGTLSLTNTIVALNTAASNPSDIAGDVTGTYNLIGFGGAGGLQNGVAGNQVDVANPLLGPLGYYGGNIESVPLLPGSPAIDGGTSGTGIPSTDMRGKPRVGTPDIGAFESQGFTLTYVSGDQQTVGLNQPLAPLVAVVTAKADTLFYSEPVAGGVVTFTVNANGNGAGADLSASSVVLDSTGQISMPGASNGVAGSYTVTASASGVSTPLTYNLTNTSAPLLYVSQTSLNLGTSTYGTPGTASTYTVNGIQLTDNVVVTAPAGVELSTDGVNWSGSLTLVPTSGTLPATVIDVRVTALVNAGSVQGTITDTSSGAAEQDVSVSGTVAPAALSVSIINDPTKTYDGTTAATLTSADYQISGLAGNDSFTVTAASGSYNSADVPVANTITVNLVSGDFTAASGTLASNYSLPTTATGPGQITPAAPTLTVAAVNITYGTTLDNSQLNGTASFVIGGQPTNVPGAFAYTIAAGTVLGAGNGQTESVTFAPTGTADYTTATGSVTVNVNQATPTINWATPAAITYGTALSGTQLDATANVPGSFSYSPAAGTVLGAGQQALSVTFTPTDTTDYTTATGSVMLAVNQATPTINWPTPAAITYGTALSGTQLDATASVAGSFTYSPAAGTVLSAGQQPLDVTFTPTDSTDYTTATGSVMLAVNQATPTINWPTPAAITYGTALSGTQLGATASVAGSFTYSPTVGTVLGTGQQPLSVTFTPTDTSDYTTASGSVMLVVNQATPTINWATPAAITYGTALSGAQLDATASVPGTLTYSPTSGTVLGAGQQPLSVTFTPTDTTDYTTATGSVMLAVNQATPTLNWPTPAAITYGTALTGTQLDATANVAGSFSYSPATGTVLGAGQQPLDVTFTPTDSTDYTTATGSVMLAVNQATPTLNWPTPAAITYGTALSGTQLDATASVVGSFTYSPAVGTVLSAGQQPLSVTFTPTDTSDYTTATGSVMLAVNQATPTINWPTPAAITYGTALSGTQFDATASVAGSFTYSPTAGTVLCAGQQPLTVTFTPTDTSDYATATGSVMLAVNQATPTINWPTPAAITYGTALSGTQLDATASVVGSFTYSPAV